MASGWRRSREFSTRVLERYHPYLGADMQREEALETPKLMTMSERHTRQSSISTPNGLDPRSSAASEVRHLASIAALCEELEYPFDEIAMVYQEELVRLAASAGSMPF